MNGGPSHIDTFDPKPGTKTGGPFKALATRNKQLQVCEHLPQLAEQAQHLAVIRSLTSKEGNHDRGQYLAHTGYAPSATVQHPSLGAWVSHELGNTTHDLPQFVSIRGASVGAGFLGVEHAPFQILHPAQGVQNLGLVRNVDAARFQQRLDGWAFLQQQFASSVKHPQVTQHNTVYAQAVKLMRSPQAKVFQLAEEPAAVRAAYGEHDFGRGCLMARRLIEAGVPFVEVTLDGWDTHYDNFTSVKKLCGELDSAYATLLRELHERRLLDSTLVIWMGEFGRTPTITIRDGRDHHPAAWSAVLAGGGTRANQVYGATDTTGEKVASQPVTIPDFFATVATLLGIDPAKELMSPVGRPIAVSDRGRVVSGLIA
jgi:uncharacterized protein (DUF1501 family)